MSKRVAITGGIGSGKSSVLEIVKALGYATFSCDAIYNEIIKTSPYIHKISKIFPNVVVNGVIDRKKLAEIIFIDKNAREKLNNVSHPLIMREMYACMNKASTPLVFAEVPLLFEGGYEDDFDAIIIVKRNEDERINAVVKRDALTKEQVQQRIQSQVNIDKYANKNNIFILENNTSFENLTQLVKLTIDKILTKSS